MKNFIVAIDQGTTSTRCVIFDRGGGVVAAAQKEHRQWYPQAGWVEHDPREILERALEVTARAMEQAGIGAGDLAGVGLTNQRETTMLWNRRTGAPLHNAIVWQDTRVDRRVEQMARQGWGEAIRRRTGLPLATYFSAPKLQWLLEHVPGARDQAETGEAAFGTVDAWLAWQLTGGTESGRHITDVTNASRTQLMDLTRCQWDDEMLAAWRIPPACLPEIVPSAAAPGRSLGEIRRGAAAGVPLLAMLGDQQAALAGQACFRAGEAKNTYGTGSFLLMHTGAERMEPRGGLLATAACRREGEPPQYALEGAIAVTGALVQWLRDGLELIRTAAEIEPLAASVADNGGVYIVPAFSGLFAPYWRSDARGVIAGLTAYAHRGHLARAALEATAYQVRDVVEAMRAEGGARLAELRVDGGMAVNELLMQFQADILDLPVRRARTTETTALGAAYAAGLAAGFWRDIEELRGLAGEGRRWRPRMAAGERERLIAGWRKAVERSLGWVEHPEAGESS
ncbi:MAG: glycerol kinase GlpK [Terriglobales bacterium]